YPLFLDALGLGKISVGPPYFNAVFVPLMLLVLATIAFGPITNWKRDDWRENLRTLRLPLILSVIGAVIAIAITWGRSGVIVTVATWLALWTIFAAFAEPIMRLRNRRDNSLKRIPLSSWGMSIAHFGFGISALGIAAVSTYGFERDAALVPGGEAIDFGGYAWQLEGLREIRGSNFEGEEALLRVFRDDALIATLHPQKRMYTTQRAAMTEAGIDARLDRDLYAALGEPLGGDAWSVRLQVKPLVRFIWLGGLLMALGGGIAAFDRRYRKPLKSPAANVGAKA
ncbi:MAG: hypothetical protein KY410_06980, partial [Proteobacteria bacterium]|nr:hypothetical protein [Pseudomonadota bacterium]